jgi:hypothetical protein
MTRMASIASFILTLVSWTSGFCNPQVDSAASKLPVYADREGYAVLSELLNHTISKSKISAIDISLVTAQEEEFVGYKDCAKAFPEDFQSAVKDFHERNKSKLRLAKEFSLAVNYRLTEKPDVQSPPPAAPGERQLEGKFVGRVLFAVSAVGFDQTKTHAIAYVSAYCGVMCAGGAYHLLIKNKQGWKEIPDSPKCEWISQKRDSQDSWGTL